MLEPLILKKESISFAGNAAGLEKFFQLEHRKVLDQNGTQSDRIIWRRGDFVLIVAITEKEEFVLIKEYKQAVEKAIWCIPAGSVKKGETPKAAALRELREETGYTGLEEKCLVSEPFYNSPDKSTERHFVVVVTGALKAGEATPERSETIICTELFHLEKVLDVLSVGLHWMAVALAMRNL